MTVGKPYPQGPDSLPLVVREQDIEDAFVEKLRDLKYSVRPDICDRRTLEANFRQKFEALNRVRLTDSEFKRLLDDLVSPDVFKNSVRLREKNDFTRDDGTPLSYTLVNIRDWCKNDFEVVHQLRINTDYSHHRYDVILLINGVPVVQVELKTLGVNPRRAMEQIVAYKSDPGNGYTRTLLCFVQLFIVSNRDSTYYFANNNDRHFRFNADEQFLPVYRWSDRDNKPVAHLDLFADAFLQKCDLGRMISRYMVLIQSEQKLLMMRPYQIYAVQAIVDCIDQNNGNGYIWHTTGSGKTLTSFKASTLLKDNPAIDKCLFVVDRKDLDRQTREEFNRFQEGCVEANTNTRALVDRLLSDDKADKVIVTTIQKLGLALDQTSTRNRQREQQGRETYRELLEPLRDKRVVLIFDECHRSQFGENHKTIKSFFPRSQLFGFTGTPIFEANATRVTVAGENASLLTTEDVFQRELHAYTITHAIEDKNVLKFHVEYYGPEGQDAANISEGARKRKVVEKILATHDAATHARRFNALFATASINDAIEYHALFQTIQAERVAADPAFVPLRIACVFSPPAEGDADVRQLQEDLQQEKADNEVDPEGKKAALRSIIAAYNTHYGTNHTVAEFDAYYQDVQQRIKNQQWANADLPGKGAEKIDVTLVVDMLLTGFDSKFLNTLYVDKNLKYHGLIQAFSRTNRVLNATKPYGHILDFRGQQDAVDTAITLFSGIQGETAAREIWLVDKADNVVAKLKDALGKLDDFMRSQDLEPVPSAVHALAGNEAKASFIERFREVQRLKTQLDQYTDLPPETRAEVEKLLPRDQLNAFRGAYLETAQHLKAEQARPDATRDTVVDQIDFEFVLFASADIDYDYIMTLCARFTSQTPGREKMSREKLIGIIEADAKFMDERETITDYVRTLQSGQGLNQKEIEAGYRRFRDERHAAALAALAQKHALATERLQAFVDAILQRMVFDGEQLTVLLEPLELNWKARRVAELALMEDLVPLLKKRAAGREISGLNAYES
ncbi:type I restriction endonuclease subunit R [Opitutales bacterium ASA1]|uniref:type I restriction endonuclease subunit R n=1 Tax=Congregicoccus parvus TaxID=3081749 RepID=UPI002B298263|nr:type I restriction endonuclease subunit R [Opitutales bacterium ASA1]